MRARTRPDTMTAPQPEPLIVNRAFHLTTLATALALAACGGSGDNASPPAESPAPSPAPAAFTLTLDTDKAVLLQGGTLMLKAHVTRSAGFDGAVQVALSGLPAGVTAPLVMIAAGATDADLLLSADAAAPHSLPTGATATGTSGAASATRSVTVTVRGVPGQVDGSFAGGGAAVTPVGIGEDYANAVAVQADGKLLVAGSAAMTGGTQFALVRYGRDGSLDAGFGNAGKVTTAIGGKGNDVAAAVAVQTDGKILVAGSSDQGATGMDFVVVRYNADGSLDAGFGNGGKVTIDFAGETDRAWALLVQPDGKIVVGGEANLGASTSGVDFALARLNADGSLDAGFGSGGKVTSALKSRAGTDIVRGLALQAVGGEQRILAVGGEGDFLAARYRADGHADTTWGTSGQVVGLFGSTIGGARAVTVLPTGEAVIAGHVGHRFAVAQLNAAGQPDNRFGPANDGRVVLGLVPNWNEATAVARQSDGRLVVGGWAYTGAGSSGDFAAMRLGADGTLDLGFGTDGVVIAPMATGTKDDQAHGLVLQADERVPAVRAVQAGEANGSNHDFAVTRLWL